jgi:hypothetical protein
MRWTERQRAMLREMGVHLWSREDAASAAAVIERGDASVATALADAARSARAPVPAAAPAPARAASVPASAATRTGRLARRRRALRTPTRSGQLLDGMLRAIGVARSASLRERRATFMAVAAAASAVGTH